MPKGISKDSHGHSGGGGGGVMRRGWVFCCDLNAKFVSCVEIGMQSLNWKLKYTYYKYYKWKFQISTKNPIYIISIVLIAITLHPDCVEH